MTTEIIELYKRKARAERTILLVDDSPVERLYLKKVLLRAGFRVLEAASGADAQLIADAGRKVDLLMTDYQMPGQNGVQLARWFREKLPGIPVLLATGMPERAAADDEYHPSFICWHKAWELDSLVDLVKRMVA
jgi:CheY-like chemotaxis protein